MEKRAMLRKECLKKFYEALKGEFEGYIQLSDSQDFIILQNDPLPTWESLHKGKNFINELCLFDGDRSINVRQINDGFVVLDKKILDFNQKNYEITSQTFLVNAKFKDTTIKGIKITQIWQENIDKLCCDFNVLEPQFLLFSGFIKGEKNDTSTL